MPAARHYTVQQQVRIAKEWNALPQDDIMREVLDDWERMRRALR
jgi:hypothetical protein